MTVGANLFLSYLGLGRFDRLSVQVVTFHKVHLNFQAYMSDR
jgi:hypothetical protein